MQIVEVIPQKRHLTKLVLSGGREILLDKSFVAEKCIKAEQTVTEEQLAAWKEESDYVRAKSRALWFLDRADHSEKALYDKLLRADIPPKACAKAIARLKELGLFLVVMASSDTEVSLQRLVFSRLTRSLFSK